MTIRPMEEGEAAMRGNARPLLHEIRHALDLLLATGEETVIDLGAIPMGPADEAELLAFLGSGEVDATIEACGRSSARETAFHGVWLVIHRNEHEQVLSRFIEIAYVPELLKSQPEDVVDSAAALAERLARH
jgi:hydrogenase-1 operon protein HyaF